VQRALPGGSPGPAEAILDPERHNLAQIEALNQRGGPTLSVTDLMADGTISAEMAAFCWVALAAGESFLTGAVPGGVGKTTLMAALLAFLPPGEKIITVADGRSLRAACARSPQTPATVLAHEIGPGHFFGYLWGRDAVDLVRVPSRGFRCVSCLHADDPRQTRASMVSLGATPRDLEGVRLRLHMTVCRDGDRPKRRVSGLYCGIDAEPEEAYRWRVADDEFERTVPRTRLEAWLAQRAGGRSEAAMARWRDCEEHLLRCLRQGVRRFADVRAAVLLRYSAWRHGR
jgi:hypothetical protein